jgi:ABC-type dipeptide/oligopeptide/nickel transport system permease component
MFQYLARRLLSVIFLLFSITFLTFVVGYLAPGDPVQAMMGSRRDPKIYAQLQHTYGLDRPFAERYLSYISGVLRGDLGKSYRFAGRPVWDLINNGAPISAKLGLAALALSAAVGVPIGIMAAVRAGSMFDHVSSAVMLIVYSVPGFVIAGVLQITQVALYQRHLPSLPTSGWGRPEHWVMPVLVLAAASTGYLATLTRASMLDVLGQEFIRTARAKGAIQARVLFHHALRNALIPIVTVLGPSVAFVVVGSFAVENVFRVPGIGFVAVQAIGTRDYPVIQSVTLILAIAVVLMNFLTDAVYTILDPRIQAH